MLIGHLAALFTIFIWGITFISTKILLANLTAEEILFIRFLLGYLALWCLCPRILSLQPVRTEATFCLAGFFGVTLYFLLENIALNYTSASNVSVIVTTAPFFTVLVDWGCFGGMRPGVCFFGGFLLATTGIILLSWPEAGFVAAPLGDFLALMAAFSWAFYSCFTARLSRLSLGSLLTTRRVFFWGLLLMGPVFLVTGWGATAATLLTLQSLGNLLFLGVGASAICFAIWTFALVRLGTGRASFYIYLVPVVTVLCAHLILHERITSLMLAGMALVIMGVAISGLKKIPFRRRWKGEAV